jgi:hypothetical protein
MFIKIISNIKKIKMRTKFIVILLLFNCLFVINNFTSAQNYSRVKIYTTQSGISELAENGIAVDFGTVFKGDYLIGEFSENEIQVIENLGYNYEVIIQDMSKYYRDRNNYNYTLEKSAKTPVNFNLGSMGGNLTYSELLLELDDMAELYPDLITVKQSVNLQTTHEGNIIYWVKISDNPEVDEENEQEVLYTALTHAREPVGMMQTVYYMWYLLENYENGGEAEYLVNNLELYFIPCVNPDGYIYNQSIEPNGGGLWRKNLRDNDNNGSFSEDEDGVDLNRNYGYEWAHDNQGSSSNPTDDTYRGPSAFSEPETQIVKYFCEQHNFILAQNHHTYGNLILYPWGYDDVVNPDFDIFSAYANCMAIQNKYATGTCFELLNYFANGDANDWMYGTLGTFSFTTESGNQNQGFWPDQADILPICETNLEMNLSLSRFALSFAIVEDLTVTIVPKHGTLDFSMQRLGMLDGNYTVSITGIDNCFQTISEPQTFSNLELLQTEEGSFTYFLNDDLLIGQQFTYTLSIYDGNFEYTQEITKTIGKPGVIFEDNGDDITSWTSTQWSSTDEYAVSPSNSITDSENAEYGDNANSPITLTQNIDLNGIIEASVEFWAKWNIENDWDMVQFKISTDNGTTWTPLEGSNTNPGSGIGVQTSGEPVYDASSDWVKEIISLNDYSGENIKFMFTIESDGGVTEDGFYFDDFRVNKAIVNNIAPVITGSNTITLLQNEVYQLTVDQLIIEDEDSSFPDDFLLIAESGEHYTIENNTITTETDYIGTITVPVKVHDGFDYSNTFNINIGVGEEVTINEEKTSYKIYPNPAKNEIFIEFSENLNISSIEVSDVTGKIIYKNMNLKSNLYNLNTSQLNSGIYFIKLIGQNIITEKLVIQK